MHNVSVSYLGYVSTVTIQCGFIILPLNLSLKKRLVLSVFKLRKI